MEESGQNNTMTPMSGAIPTNAAIPPMGAMPSDMVMPDPITVGPLAPNSAPTTPAAEPVMPVSEPATPETPVPVDPTTPVTPETPVATTKPAEQVASATVPMGAVKIETLLEECVKRNASDIHVQVGLPPHLRIDGSLVPINGISPITQEVAEKLIRSTLDDEQWATLEKDKEFDYSFAFGDVARFRVNAFNERGHLAAAFRLIVNKIPSLEDMNLPNVISSFADFPRGLVLVTGPTGSGKSTTLAALLNKINKEKSLHILTIEDPIEYSYKSERSIVVQREVHDDTVSFSRALKSALRQDPDVVLVGEMRDLETMSSAITIAETGHLVFATLHTNSASQSIDRMIDVFPAHQQPQVRSQLSNILMAICAQRLVPKIGGGRVAACEIMIANPAIRSIIREGKTHQLDTTIQTGADQGMQTMDRTLAKFVQEGIVAADTAREFAVDLSEFDRLVRGS